MPPVVNAARSRKLYVGGLDNRTGNEQLIRAFLSWGAIEEGWVQVDAKLQTRMFGFLAFALMLTHFLALSCVFS